MNITAYDYQGIMRALVKNAKAGSVVEGGSTLTQQLVKITMLESERTLKRKIEEFFLAQEVENQYTKDEILKCT
ncbi:transglycosylase domain-containing protein [[Brevibacterium] frigoritolerans]|uniref:Transglycosylase domain-containing protein n=1 Tax=Peribacillus frigoritolerans TaxID=450367 RepID=A0A941FRF9_9BACI|nr:transglycosylase domain-containing protein [Peribacillus frigoritolerans]